MRPGEVDVVVEDTDAFERGINQHGYAFQHRVVEEVARLKRLAHSKSHWELLGLEVPVAARGFNTRADFVLHFRRSGSQLWLLVAECKRVNPKFGSWCFAKGAYQTPAWLRDQTVFEIMALGGESGGFGGPQSSRVYDVGFALKTEKGGDAQPISNDRDALEKACYQVSQALNGLIDSIAGDLRFEKYLKGVEHITLAPVVFTTASLTTSKVDLANADLASGEVRLEEPPVGANWLYYQYPMSPALKHDLPRPAASKDSFAEVMARDYVRTIAIVSPSGIEPFLEQFWLDE